jgi:hypothetical protein
MRAARARKNYLLFNPNEGRKGKKNLLLLTLRRAARARKNYCLTLMKAAKAGKKLLLFNPGGRQAKEKTSKTYKDSQIDLSRTNVTK